jgi:hypothetical protein
VGKFGANLKLESERAELNWGLLAWAEQGVVSLRQWFWWSQVPRRSGTSGSGVELELGRNKCHFFFFMNLV